MSAYAHQMEREYSAQSLMSRGGSEMRSRYAVESGFYMTSFAAIIFLGALVTVGVLFITLIIALTVMLQSCESRSKGVIEIQTPNEGYSHCKIFSLYAELNNLEPDDFPPICKDLFVQNIKEGQYKKDLNSSMQLVQKFFDSVVPINDGLDVVMMDVDDILPSDPEYADLLMPQSNQYGCIHCYKEANDLKQKLLLKLYLELQAKGWSLILLSRKPEKLRNATIQHLIFAGYRGWSDLIVRSPDEMEMDSREYILKRRMAIQRGGFRITSIISSRMDALTGSPTRRVFKLPNPTYYYFAHPEENIYEPK